MCAGIYVIFLLILRRKIISPFEPLHVQVFLLSLSGSWLYYYFYKQNASLYWLSIIYAQTIIIILMYRSRIEVDFELAAKRDSFVNSLNFKIFFAVCIFLIVSQGVWLAYVSGFHFPNGKNLNQRLLILKEMRILTYLSMPVASFLPVFIYIYWRRPQIIWCIIAIISYVIGEIFLGSKASIVSAVLFVAGAVFVRELDRAYEGQPMKIFWMSRAYIYVLGIGVACVAVILFVISYLFDSKIHANGQITAQSLLITRLLMNYDHFHFIIASDFLDKEPKLDFSFVAAWSQFLLKPFGLISMDYNNVGEYVAKFLIGVRLSDHNNRYLSFPNSNLALELFFSYGPLVGVVLFPIIFGITIYILRKFEPNRYGNFHSFIIAYFLLFNPLYVVVDGTSFAGSCISLTVIYSITVLISGTIRACGERLF